MTVSVLSKFRDLDNAVRLRRRGRGERICGWQDVVLVGVGHPDTIAGAVCVGKLSMPLDAGEGVVVRAICNAGAALRDIKFGADCPDTTTIADGRLSRHKNPMKNILIVDGAMNATFSLFQATDEEFATLFPNNEEMDVIEDVIARTGEDAADDIFSRVWGRPILKCEAQGIHATLIYGDPARRDYLPPSRREVDWDDGSINEAQRRLFRSRR